MFRRLTVALALFACGTSFAETPDDAVLDAVSWVQENGNSAPGMRFFSLYNLPGMPDELGIFTYPKTMRAYVRGTVRHKGRNVESANTDDLHARIIGGEHQRATILVEKGRFGFDSGGLHQRQSLVENPSFGDGKDDWRSHYRRALLVRCSKGKE